MPDKNTQTRIKIPKTLIIGLGNPICSDDAAGIKAGAMLYDRIKNRIDVSFCEASGRGFDLLGAIVNYEHVIIIDSIQTGKGKIGQLYQIESSSSSFKSFSHSMGIFEQLKLGREMNLPLPKKISIYGIEVKDPYTFGEGMTEGMEQAIVEAVETIATTEFGALQKK
jgi:hydrogenase maturation protease